MDLQKEREAFELVVANKLQNSLYHSVFFNEATGWYYCADDAPAGVQVFCCDLNSDFRIWKAAKAQAVPGWISVKDSLPNRQVNVLVASKHNFVCIASLTNNHKNNKFYDGDSLAINSITHWMPLPKPPKSTGASQ